MSERDERVLSRIPTRHRGALDAVDLSPSVEGWRGDPWCLIFLGPHGRGKSWCAAKAAYTVACDPKYGKSPLGAPLNLVWINVATLGAQLRREIGAENGGAPGIVERLSGASLLVLDDLVANRATEYLRDTLRHVICTRYDEILPTIVTAEDLSGLEDRLKSRLAEGVVTTLSGPDRRRTKGGRQ